MSESDLKSKKEKSSEENEYTDIALTEARRSLDNQMDVSKELRKEKNSQIRINLLLGSLLVALATLQTSISFELAFGLTLALIAISFSIFVYLFSGTQITTIYGLSSKKIDNLENNIGEGNRKSSLLKDHKYVISENEERIQKVKQIHRWGFYVNLIGISGALGVIIHLLIL